MTSAGCAPPALKPDAGRAVGQQELGQPAVDARDQACRAGRAHSQPSVRARHDDDDGHDGGT
jgi:hypothetical protein